MLAWKASSVPESHMVRKGEKPRPCCSLVVNPPSWEMPAFLGAVCLRGEGFVPFIAEVLGAASSRSPLYQAQLQGDSSASFSYNSYLKTNKSSRTHKHTQSESESGKRSCIKKHAAWGSFWRFTIKQILRTPKMFFYPPCRRAVS